MRHNKAEYGLKDREKPRGKLQPGGQPDTPATPKGATRLAYKDVKPVGATSLRSHALGHT
eukprot:353823-Chlamydomonas_euryale.AAC.2